MADDESGRRGRAGDARMDSGRPGPFKHGRSGVPLGSDVMAGTFIAFPA